METFEVNVTIQQPAQKWQKRPSRFSVLQLSRHQTGVPSKLPSHCLYIYTQALEWLVAETIKRFGESSLFLGVTCG